MAWTTPMTFTAGSILTAAQLNTFLRDDMLETDVGRATTTGSFFMSRSANLIAERNVKVASVFAAESTAATDYVDLSTVGPSVTCELTSRALVFISARMHNDTANRGCQAHYAVDGATQRDPQKDGYGCLNTDGLDAVNSVRYGTYEFLTGLNEGEHTFTMKYRVGAGNGTFNDRTITVIPM